VIETNTVDTVQLYQNSL